MSPLPLLPLFPVTSVGSLPRPAALLRAQKLKVRGELDASEFERLADDAVLKALALQERAGVDIVTDGEQRRDNFYSFVAEKLEGVQLMSLAEMLHVVEDKDSFERILQTLDVPAFSISNPTCVGKINRRVPLALDELQFLKRHTRKPVKIPLPGPYLLTRAMYVPEITRAVYPTKEALAEDVVRILQEEIEDLTRAGVEFIQLDEPVLTELVFTRGQTRTFMCAALAATKNPADELRFAVELLNQVLRAVPTDGPRTAIHVCRGNWSRDETTLLRGSYAPLASTFERMNVRQLVLEYATERAGEILPFENKEIGLGVVNPRTERVESEDEIRNAVRQAMKHVSAERLFLNPDCGFGTFSNRPVNSEEIAFQKLKRIATVARTLRGDEQK